MLNEIIKIADILLESSRQNNKDKEIHKGYVAFDSDTIWKYGCDRLNCATALYKAGYRKHEENMKESPVQPIRLKIKNSRNDETDGCPVCRTEFFEKHHFCPNCGIELNWE